MNYLLKKLLISFFLSAVLSSVAVADALNPDVIRIYQRVVGIAPRAELPTLKKMSLLLDKGKYFEAAKLATTDSLFYSVSMRNFSAPYTNLTQSPLSPLDDLQALFIGIARDDLDARNILTADFRYQAYPSLGLPAVSLANNDHYAEFEKRGLDFNRDLVRINRQWETIPEAAGALTTRSWAKLTYDAGTNRRAVKTAMEYFMCAPIEVWRQPSLSDYYVRRDVDRKPGGNPSTFQALCRGCHAPMDSMGGAFARFDFADQKLTHNGFASVAPKMNRNGDVYPDGFVSLDDSWINLVSLNSSLNLGWRGATSGSGILGYGTMLSSSRGFSRCLVKKVFKQVCLRKPENKDTNLVERLTDQFEQGYVIRDLFANVASQEDCVEHSTKLSKLTQISWSKK